MSPQARPPERYGGVQVGQQWYVWGEHHRVTSIDVRYGDKPYATIVPLDLKRKKATDTVPVSALERHGTLIEEVTT